MYITTTQWHNNTTTQWHNNTMTNHNCWTNCNCQMFEKAEQQKRTADQKHLPWWNTLWSFPVSVLNVLTSSCLFEKEPPTIKNPSHNGTPHLLHVIFGITLSLIHVLLDCQMFEKKWHPIDGNVFSALCHFQDNTGSQQEHLPWNALWSFPSILSPKISFNCSLILSPKISFNCLLILSPKISFNCSLILSPKSETAASYRSACISSFSAQHMILTLPVFQVAANADVPVK